MTLKERFENNLTLFVIIIWGAGFGIGFAVSQFFAQQAQTHAQPSESTCSSRTLWENAARKEQWLPAQECPAFPLEVRLSSPGSGSSFPVDPRRDQAIGLPFVLTSTRPLSEKSELGLVFQVKNTTNFHVVFPFFSARGAAGVYRSEGGVDLPFKLAPAMTIDVWGLVVDDKRRIGALYSSLDQVKSSAPGAFITERVTLHAVPRE